MTNSGNGGSAPPRLAGIVLCGGRSTRMGTSKALLPFGDETMLQRVVRLLGGVLPLGDAGGPPGGDALPSGGGVVSTVVCVAAVGQELPPLPADVIVTRDERESRGPLEGLRAGLKALPGDVEAAYVTSCDVPLLVPAFVSEMFALATGYDIAVMEIEGFPHPLSAVYRRSVLPEVEALLAQDRLRPVFLFDAMRTRRVAPSEIRSDPKLQTLQNLNTPEDYERALRALRGSSG